MKFIKTSVILFCLFFSTILLGQLKEMEVRQEAASGAIPIFPDHPDNAAIIIYSSIPGLRFESTTGGIVDSRENLLDGKYIVILRPERQIVKIKSIGYKENNIKLLSLQQKDVLYFSIEPKKETLNSKKGKFILNSIPQGAYFEVVGLPISGKTPYESDEFLAQVYKVKLQKENYEPIEVLIEIEQGKVISKTVELVPMLDFIETEIRVTSFKSDNENVKNLFYDNHANEYSLMYDLDDDLDDEYLIELYLRKKKDEDFNYEISKAIGAIGTGKHAGRQKKIIWDAGKEFPGGLESDDFYLELEVEKIGGSTWYYWVGAVLLGGSAAAYLLTQKKSGETPPATSTGDSFGEYPGRP